MTGTDLESKGGCPESDSRGLFRGRGPSMYVGFASGKNLRATNMRSLFILESLLRRGGGRLRWRFVKEPRCGHARRRRRRSGLGRVPIPVARRSRAPSDGQGATSRALRAVPHADARDRSLATRGRRQLAAARRTGPPGAPGRRRAPLRDRRRQARSVFAMARCARMLWLCQQRITQDGPSTPVGPPSPPARPTSRGTRATPCCPARCPQLYRQLRELGYGPRDANRRAVESMCFNGLREQLGAP